MRPWTFALVKPDGVANPIAVRWLLSAMHCEGFVVTKGCRLTVTPDLASELYSNHQDAFFFGRLIRHICSGPSVAMCMELRKLNHLNKFETAEDDCHGEDRQRYDAISASYHGLLAAGGQQQQQPRRPTFDPLEAINRWRILLGPSKLFANIYLSGCAEFDQIARYKNFRQMFALSDTRNFCHGSDSLDSLLREFSLFEPIMKPVERPETELFELDDYRLTEKDYLLDRWKDDEEEEEEEEAKDTF